MNERTTELVCAECGAASDNGEGWKTFLTIDGQGATYCPDCAQREFGGVDA